MAELVPLMSPTYVETVTLLSQREVKDKATVVIDDFKLTKVEMKPTYDEIKKYVFDKYGVNISSLNIAKTKTEFGAKERENYNLPKSGHPKQPNLMNILMFENIDNRACEQIP